MRGKPGTPILLTVARKDVDTPLTFTLLREIINVKSVRAKMIEPGYGYIRVAQFQEHTGEDLAKSIRELVQAGRAEGAGARSAQRSGRPAATAGRASSSAFLPKDALVVYTDGRTPDARMRLSASHERLRAAAATTT